MQSSVSRMSGQIWRMGTDRFKARETAAAECTCVWGHHIEALALQWSQKTKSSARRCVWSALASIRRLMHSHLNLHEVHAEQVRGISTAPF